MKRALAAAIVTLGFPVVWAMRLLDDLQQALDDQDVWRP